MSRLWEDFEAIFDPTIMPVVVPPRGIYPLHESATWARCGCGSYGDGSACTNTGARWVISYGPENGTVYACDKHADEKRGAR